MIDDYLNNVVVNIAAPVSDTRASPTMIDMSAQMDGGRGGVIGGGRARGSPTANVPKTAAPHA